MAFHQTNYVRKNQGSLKKTLKKHCIGSSNISIINSTIKCKKNTSNSSKNHEHNKQNYHNKNKHSKSKISGPHIPDLVRINFPNMTWYNLKTVSKNIPELLDHMCHDLKVNISGAQINCNIKDKMTSLFGRTILWSL